MLNTLKTSSLNPVLQDSFNDVPTTISFNISRELLDDLVLIVQFSETLQILSQQILIRTNDVYIPLHHFELFSVLFQLLNGLNRFQLQLKLNLQQQIQLLHVKWLL